MLRIVFAFAAAVTLLAGMARAEAAVEITVDKSAQKLTVVVDGATKYEWPVSTARRGYKTPNGSYKPEWLARKHFSRQYHWSPMPHSIFFHEGYAIHGSYEVARIGHPASHGCIRLAPKNAALLFALVQERKGDTTITVTGEAPVKTMIAKVKHKSKKQHTAKRKHQKKQHLAAKTSSTGTYQTNNGSSQFMFPFYSPSQHYNR